MLSYTGTKSGLARLYAYRRAIWGERCESQEAAEKLAKKMLDRLSNGNIETAIQVAMWTLENLDRDAINISLGPHLYLDVRNRVIRDMDGCPVAAIPSQ